MYDIYKESSLRLQTLNPRKRRRSKGYRPIDYYTFLTAVHSECRLVLTLLDWLVDVVVRVVCDSVSGTSGIRVLVGVCNSVSATSGIRVLARVVCSSVSATVRIYIRFLITIDKSYILGGSIFHLTSPVEGHWESPTESMTYNFTISPLFRLNKYQSVGVCGYLEEAIG